MKRIILLIFLVLFASFALALDINIMDSNTLDQNVIQEPLTVTSQELSWCEERLENPPEGTTEAITNIGCSIGVGFTNAVEDFSNMLLSAMGVDIVFWLLIIIIALIIMIAGILLLSAVQNKVPLIFIIFAIAIIILAFINLI